MTGDLEGRLVDVGGETVTDNGRTRYTLDRVGTLVPQEGLLEESTTGKGKGVGRRVTRT